MHKHSFISFIWAPSLQLVYQTWINSYLSSVIFIFS